MFLCFIIFGALVLVTAWLSYMRELTGALIAGFFAVCVLAFGCIYSENKALEAKVQALDAVGIEYLSKEEVYNKSQAELDKMFKVSTLGSIYYYDIGENKDAD